MGGTICIMAGMQLNHSDIIGLWPTLGDFAADLGVRPNTARGWKRRNSIPPNYWRGLIEKARERRVYVTPDHLMAQVAQRRAA
jgi:hypothetical protein